jgi:hypothetical protein
VPRRRDARSRAVLTAFPHAPARCPHSSRSVFLAIAVVPKLGMMHQIRLFGLNKD